MIKIRGIDYKVNGFYLPKQIEDLMDGDRIELGHVDFLRARIDICMDTAPQIQEETLLHEVVHVIVKDEIGIGESEVSRISETLYGFLRDNGLIREGWMEKIIDNSESGGEIVNADPVRSVDRAAQEGVA